MISSRPAFWHLRARASDMFRPNSRARGLLEYVVFACIAVVAGYVSVHRQSTLIRADTAFTVIGLALIGGIVLASLRRPTIAYAALLASFPAGDLVRKLGTGDPRIIFLKDILLVIGTVCLWPHRRSWADMWRAVAPWWKPLIAFFLWYFVAAVNAGAYFDWRVPLVGFRLTFEFLPLVALGWWLSLDERRLRRAVAFGCTVLCAVTLLGIAQAIIGPKFLGNPKASQFFTHLELLRQIGGQVNKTVFQPSGPFAETGRFANWTFVNFAVGLALLPHTRAGRWRYFVLAVGILGVFAASGRLIVVASVVLTSIVMLRSVRISAERAVRVGFAALILLSTLLVAAKIFVPGQLSGRTEFITGALNFTSSDSEVSFRIPHYLDINRHAIADAGLIGRGAGTQGLGLQYIGSSAKSLLRTEGGFATVVVETGLVGLGLWLLWVLSCLHHTRRYAKRIAGPLGDTARTLVAAITLQMCLIFFFGISAIQDYVFNSWFFLVVGLVAGLGVASTRNADDVNDELLDAEPVYA